MTLFEMLHDTKERVVDAQKRGMAMVIPPSKHRPALRDYDHYIYRLQPLEEKTGLRLKG